VASDLRSILLERHPDACVLVASNGRIVDSNAAARALATQLGVNELTDVPALAACVTEPESCPSEVQVEVARGDGVMVLSVEAIPGVDPAGSCGLVLRDLTRSRQLQQELVEQALQDPLTGLPNRRSFERKLSDCLADASRRGVSLALILLDLDRFKETNDTLGHAAGDQLLQHVAETARNAVRSRDVVGRPANETKDPSNLARLGGDEFVILLSEIASPDDASDVADRVLRQLNKPISLLGAKVAPSASMGIAVFPHDGADARSLLRSADQALYHAKEHGRNQFQVYHPGLNQTAQRRRAIRQDLLAALESEEVDVYYQPKVDLHTGAIVGGEALLRWQHPVMGALPPDEFVSVAERSGLVAELGRYVLERVCRDMKRFDYVAPRHIAVNVCPSEFSRSEYFSHFTETLSRHGVSPESLQLEITERTLLQDSIVAATNLEDLRTIGIPIYLDDFGTGKSSLSDLIRHTVDGLKLDRSFIAEIDSNVASAGVVRALLQLASELDLRVVAEGVESVDHATLLRGFGCDEAQGYYWEKAIPAEDFFLLATAAEPPFAEQTAQTAATAHLETSRELTGYDAVHIVSKSGVVQSLLARFLRRYTARTEVSCSLTADAAGAPVQLSDRDLLAIELSAEPSDAIEMLEELRNQQPLPALLVIGKKADPELVRRADELGAIGFLTLPLSFRQLSRAVRADRRPFKPTSARLRAAPIGMALLLDPETERPCATWEIQDISTDGAFLLTFSSYSPGDSLQLSLQIGDERLRVTGRVARSQTPDWTRGAGVGVHFEHDADSRATLETILAAQMNPTAPRT